MTPRKIVTLAVFAALVGLLGLELGRGLPSAVARARMQACLPLGAVPRDEPAPDFSLPDHSGRPISLSSLRGRVVFLNFWATWCPPCREEMPAMDRLAKQMRDEDFAMVAVSVDESWDLVRNFFPGGTTMTVLLDTKKESPTRYGTEKFPETYLIDKQGRIRYHVVNKRDWASPEARRCIESLLDS